MIKKLFSFFPNIFVFILVVVPVIIFIGYFSIKSNFFGLIKGGNTELQNIISVEEKQKYLDSDNDGLLNWQEVLYKTKNDIADTDGDGISDGVEVLAGTDPTDPFNKQSLNSDEISKGDEMLAQTSYRDDKSLSKTDIIARDLFVKLTELKQSNLASNDNAVKQAIEDLLKENKIIINETYTLDDLNISNRTTLASFKITLEKILNKYNLQSFSNESVLLAQYLDTKDEKYLAKISSQVGQYQKLEKELQMIKAPTSLSIPYLEYLNSFALFVQMSQSFQDFNNDPVLVSSMVLLYNDIEKRFISSTQALSFFLNNK